MTLIKSISGIRGTIGGAPKDNLTPIDIVKYASSFGQWVIESGSARRVVIGRDARISGEMVSNLIANTLVGMGIDVIDLGLSTTPTVEIAVPKENAGGGIIITASHNPVQWNALKLLNSLGEFLSAEDGEQILDLAEKAEFNFAEVFKLGQYSVAYQYLDKHIEDIISLTLVDKKAITKKGFKVAIDCVNSSGGIAIPKLLQALGVEVIEKIYCEPNGNFPHNPEPLPEHLTEICERMEGGEFDVGFVVDPDVDRLAIIDENGVFIGEEYTLVLVSDYVLSQTPGDVVSNLSSSGALTKIAEKYNQKREEAAVGEVNVVTKMKSSGAIIGGEGNGGIIYPELHYGRDSLVGIALFLTHLAKSNKLVSQLKSECPQTHISKNKIKLSNSINVADMLEKLSKEFEAQPQNHIDGVKIYFGDEWTHIRKSNTEPIIRIYSESTTKEKAENVFLRIKEVIDRII
ncbi:MAG: phosphomannomutase [Cyclobacteriaceae bacterium]|jgi:phosphomannomutase